MNNYIKDESATRASTGHGKYIIARGATEPIQKLDQGFSPVQTLGEDRFLLQKPYLSIVIFGEHPRVDKV